MITYALWKNRNAWVFEDERRQHGPIRIAALVAKEYNMIKIAHRENVRDQNDNAREWFLDLFSFVFSLIFIHCLCSWFCLYINILPSIKGKYAFAYSQKKDTATIGS
jgi:hypothetical protein